MRRKQIGRKLEIARELGRLLAESGETVETCQVCKGKGLVFSRNYLRSWLCGACKGTGAAIKGVECNRTD